MKIRKRKTPRAGDPRPPYAGRVGETGARAERPEDGRKPPPADKRRGAKGPAAEVPGG